MTITTYSQKTGASAESVQVLAQSCVAISTQSVTVNNVVKQVTIPGGTLGPNDAIEVRCLWSKTGTAGTFNAKLSLGSTTDFFMRQASIGATNVSFETGSVIYNNNSTSAQKFLALGTRAYEASTSATGTLSVDTSADTTVNFIAYCGDAADTMTLEAYTITVIRAV